MDSMVKPWNDKQYFYMENYILITWLNDFIFCPYSIYLHNVYNNLSDSSYYSSSQTKGRYAHKNIDAGNYSTKKDDLIGIDVISHKYGLVGKIDLFHKDKGSLIERKRQIKTIYDGYKYQLYAQYFCLKEIGYDVQKLKFHSMVDNKSYPIDEPTGVELEKFEKHITAVKDYNPLDISFSQNIQKCKYCIYSNLCDKTDL